MTRKEINIFGTSFLDLLSGALAAVIILFVIVPKGQQQPREEPQPRENTVPEEEYRQLQSQLQESQQRVEQLERQVAELQRQNSTTNGVSNGRIFGIDAELGIVCLWRENVDVDLYVRNVATGKVCYFQNKNTNFGNMSEDVRGHTSNDDGRYELFYQKKIVPGTYEVIVKIYTSDEHPWNGKSANIEGFVVMHPGKSNQQLIKYPNKRLNSTEKVLIGRLTVTNNAITLN